MKYLCGHYLPFFSIIAFSLQSYFFYYVSVLTQHIKAEKLQFWDWIYREEWWKANISLVRQGNGERKWGSFWQE